MDSGSLVISLDFELFWGLKDKKHLDNYKENLYGARKAIPVILELFNHYGIHATWSTVGLLFFGTKKELLKGLPVILPEYQNEVLSPYKQIDTIVGENETKDPLRFAPSLIKKIIATPNQRVGSHTFSHFYCLEAGQNIDSFRADIISALDVAKMNDIKIESLVFPCNQYNKEYIKICEELLITSFRGNELSWVYRARNGEDETLIRRCVRLLDSFINISGHNTYSWDHISKEYPINIPSSRFLRPHSKKLSFLTPLKLKRIKTDLTYAAQNNEIYHLWWHPHNFGKDLEQNIDTLKQILDHFKILQKNYNFQSLNMEEVTQKILEVNINGDRENSDFGWKRRFDKYII